MEETAMATTYEDVLNLFRETNQLIKEQSRETDRKFQETERLLKEQSQETDRRFQEADRRFQETERLLKEQFRETERLLNEKFQETDRFLKEQSRASEKKLNALENLFTSQWGRLMESLVEGDLVNLLTARGITIADTTSRIKGRHPVGGNYEFDIIAHNGDEIVVVEVKTTLRPAYVKIFLDKLDHLKEWLPRYAHNRIYGAMAWLNADPSVEAMLINRGLFSIRATGNSATIQNEPTFTPRAW
jgi:Holliday junction resolvase